VPANKTYAVLLAAVAVLLIANGLIYATGRAATPTWSELTQSKDSADPGETVTLSVLAEADEGLKSAGLNVSAGAAWGVTETQALSGSQALVTFRYTVPSYNPGTKISWNVVIIDSTDKKAITGTKRINVTDSVLPQIEEQMQEADEVVIGGALLLSARLSDNYKLATASFESNESGEFETIREYKLEEADALVSMSWSNPDVKEGTVVDWRVTAKDSWGNTKTSDVLAFKVRGCPPCPSASEWSNCEVKAGKAAQTQIYYECNKNTKFACLLRTKTQTCTPGVSREEAKGALDAANLAVATAKAGNRNTAEAEQLLAAAQASYAKGEWSSAKANAAEAKTAAETAKVVKPPEPNYLPYVAVVMLILIAAGVLLKFGKLKLPEKKPAEEKPAEGEKELDVCAICGRTVDTAYTCTECGRKVCLDDSRTYEGDVYCTDDLKKKGLL